MKWIILVLSLHLSIKAQNNECVKRDARVDNTTQKLEVSYIKCPIKISDLHKNNNNCMAWLTSDSVDAGHRIYWITGAFKEEVDSPTFSIVTKGGEIIILAPFYYDNVSTVCMIPEYVYTMIMRNEIKSLLTTNKSKKQFSPVEWGEYFTEFFKQY